jgi:hypothetical protein
MSAETKQDKKYTAEVLQALKGLETTIPQPPDPGPPEGKLRYHIAVEGTVLQGVAPAKTVAAQLRTLADEIEKE